MNSPFFLAASGAEAPTIRAVVTASGLWLGGLAVTAGAAAGVAAAAGVVWWVRSTGSARLAGVHADPMLTSLAMPIGLAACILAALAPANLVARQALLGALKSGRAPAASGRRSTIAGAAVLLAAAGLPCPQAGPWAARPRIPTSGHSRPPQFPRRWPGERSWRWWPWCSSTGRLTAALTSRTRAMPLPLRMAARDSARNRSRTVPAALFAVLAATTLASAALVLRIQPAGQRLSHSWSALENQAYLPLSLAQPALADGTAAPAVILDPQRLSAAVSGALDSVSWTRTVTTPAPVENCGFGDGADPWRTRDA